jgi:predicted nucleic acid-binding protein
LSRFILDTTPLSAYLTGRSRAVALGNRFVDEGHDVRFSLLVYGEIIEYFQGSPDDERRQLPLRAPMVAVPPVELTAEIMDRYASLRRQMRRPYGDGLIGVVDTIIAATAIEHDATSATCDPDVLRVPGLRVHLLERRTFIPAERAGEPQQAREPGRWDSRCPGSRRSPWLRCLLKPGESLDSDVLTDRAVGEPGDHIGSPLRDQAG